MAVTTHTMLAVPYLSDPVDDVSTFRPGEGANGWDAVAVEEGRTNILASPRDLSTSWASVRVTISAAAIDPPALLPSLSIQSIDEDGTAASTHFVQTENLSLTDSTTYVSYSILKKGARSWATVQSRNKANVFVARYFDLENGVLGNGSAGLVGSGIDDLGGGWYLCWIAWDSGTGATNPIVNLYVAEGNGDITFDGLSQVSIYHAHSQLEQGAFPTSPVVGTRAEGELHYLASLLRRSPFKMSGWFNSTPGQTYANNRTLFSTGDGAAAGNNIYSYIASSDDTIKMLINGSTYSQHAAADWSTDRRFSIARNGSYVKTYLNGVAGTGTATLSTHEADYVHLGDADTDYQLNGMFTDVQFEILPESITFDEIEAIEAAQLTTSGAQLNPDGETFRPMLTVTLPPADVGRARNLSMNFDANKWPRLSLASDSNSVKAISYSWSGLTRAQFNAAMDWWRIASSAPRKVTLVFLQDDSGTKSQSCIDLVLDTATLQTTRNDASEEYGFSFAGLIVEER